jgi:lantibiotic biosynthesis protein
VDVARRLREAYAREFRVDGVLRREIGQRFRQERRALEGLRARQPAGSLLAAGAAALGHRSTASGERVAELRRRAEEGLLEVPLSNLAESLAHMRVNRMLRWDQRRHEVVLYDFLTRIWESRLARGT